MPGHCGQLLGGLRVHLHVVLEETLPERGLVVGRVRLGLDGRPQADRAALSLAVTRDSDSSRQRAVHSDWYRHTGTACHWAAAFQATPRNAGESLSDCLTPSPGLEASLRPEPAGAAAGAAGRRGAGPPAAAALAAGCRTVSDCHELPVEAQPLCRPGLQESESDS